MKVNVKVREDRVNGLDFNYDTKSNPDKNNIVNLGFVVDNDVGEQFVEIDEELMLQKEVIQIEVAERGGCRIDNSGWSRVVCGMSGRKLKPFLISPKSGYARFGVTSSCVVVKGYINGIVKVEKLLIEEEIDGVWFKNKLIFKGDFDILCRKGSQFINAAFAARSKAVCLKCSHIHYAKDVDGVY